MAADCADSHRVAVRSDPSASSDRPAARSLQGESWAFCAQRAEFQGLQSRPGLEMINETFQMENEVPGKRQARSNPFCFLFSIFHLSSVACHLSFSRNCRLCSGLWSPSSARLELAHLARKRRDHREQVPDNAVVGQL